MFADFFSHRASLAAAEKKAAGTANSAARHYVLKGIGLVALYIVALV